MQRINKKNFWNRILAALSSVLMVSAAGAVTPRWTFDPLTATTIAVPVNGTAVVQYKVTNQTTSPDTLTLQPTQGIAQITTGLGVCGNPFVIRGKDSCILSLQINGSQLSGPIDGGPIICRPGSAHQCYQPNAANILHVTLSPAKTDGVIAVTSSPLTLTVNGSNGQLTISNTSTQVTATNIVSNFKGTALDGTVTETGNTCANVLPGSSCTLTYTPGSTVVPKTNFTIRGTNTNALTAAIGIQSNSTLVLINPNSGTALGGAGVTLTGIGLTGATAVFFDGLAASRVNVVNSTTVTAVTPAHVAGIVDVSIVTPYGRLTLANGYTYVATEVGQPSDGGTIACLKGGVNNLIAATTDNHTDGMQWGGYGTAVGTSDTDGATNTTTIVNKLGAGNYAAQLCNDFEVDSEGHTPCQTGFTCYDDWFLPAKDQLNCLFTNRAAIGGFAGAYYWSSTELLDNPAKHAWYQLFTNGNQYDDHKGYLIRARCVRAIT
jgi:hypothetical protein